MSSYIVLNSFLAIWGQILLISYFNSIDDFDWDLALLIGFEWKSHSSKPGSSSFLPFFFEGIGIKLKRSNGVNSTVFLAEKKKQRESSDDDGSYSRMGKHF